MRRDPNSPYPYGREMKLIKRRKLVTAAFTLFLLLSQTFSVQLAQTRSDTEPSSVTQLQSAIDQIIQQPQFATTRWGILIESLDQNRVLYSREANQLFVPASNLKLYTTAAALVQLGPDYRFRTSVLVPASPDEMGIIKGDVVLYGRGDPNLSSRTRDGGTLTSLESLAKQLYQAGAREIRGDIIGDESYFSGPPLGTGWEWDDLQWYYGAEISALSIDDNAITLSILPDTTPGNPAKVFTVPETGSVTIVNKVVTAPTRTKQEIGIHRGLEDNVIEIWGQAPTDGSGFYGYLAVHQPALYAATLFSESLVRRGIKITGQVRRADAKFRQQDPLDLSKLKELAFVESAPLSAALRILNKISQNLHAELLLRTLGVVAAGEGTVSKGLTIVNNLLQSAQARRQGIALQDGSGLSRQNLITPATTVDLLRYMHQHPQRDVFLNSLPIAGIDGTLESRMIGTPAQRNVRAKTGTLRYTSTLSGYVTTASGERLVFSIMANDHTGQLSEVLDATNLICVLLAQFDARQ
ncbi:MAG: D-alanyl-D-alanine carboxypeptidase/D-alanyl-D-alanine-endopeptidase [Acidobacteria bacterium]|nr:D-alanyl-D-alanine carboxypeptidase/D-alanyl-D-alanine-endopeptidase [Acidobacteriota bacterium]